MPDKSLQNSKMGRPTKINDELITQAWEYLKETTSIAVNAGGLLPTKERLALKLGINRDTLYQWAKQSDDFSDILATLDLMQADMLLQNGLVNRYNPTIAKLLLSKHGYVDKTEVDNTHSVVEFVNDVPRPKKDVIEGEVVDEK